MNNDNFSPFLITAKKNDSILSLSLPSLLAQTTEHKLLILKGFNTLSKEELIHFCESQASLLQWDFGPVMDMQVRENPKNYLFTEGDVPLHWDGAFHQEPRFLFFQCIKAPKNSEGGETLFSNTESIWQTASPSEKALWHNLQLSFSTEKLAHYGGTILRHLVSQHPDTGNTILRFAEPVGEDYLNPVQVQVMGKNKLDSDSLLSALSQRFREKAHCYQHRWQEGDYLISDNFSLLHGRRAFQATSSRHLRRIQIL